MDVSETCMQWDPSVMGNALVSVSSPLDSSCGRASGGKVAYPLPVALLSCFESAQQFKRPLWQQQGGLPSSNRPSGKVLRIHS